MGDDEYKTLDQNLLDSLFTMGYADMVIYCSNGSVPIHRCILAAASQFLRPLLRDYNPIESHTILLPDITVSTMKHVLSLIYTGRTVSPTLDDFSDIIEAVKLLGIDFDCNPYDETEDVEKRWDISEVFVLSYQEVINQPEPVTSPPEFENTAIEDCEGNESYVIEHDVVELEDDDSIEYQSDEKTADIQLKNKAPSISGPSSSPHHISFHSAKKQDNHLNISSIEKHGRIQKKSKLQTKPMYVGTSETANVIKDMISKGQIHLAPRPPRESKSSCNASLMKSISTVNFSRYPDTRTLKNIPQNVLNLGSRNGNGNRNTLLSDTMEEIQVVETSYLPDMFDENSQASGDISEVLVIDNSCHSNSDTFSTPQLEDPEEYRMTPEEILDAAKISSQKDHPYAHFGYKQKRSSQKAKVK